MKKCFLVIPFCVLLTINACTESYERPKEVDPKEYNKKIEAGTQADEEWVKTPEGIAKKLFPRIAHQEGNPSYIIEENHLSDVNRKITVTEEGTIDDEVLGVKNIICVKSINGRWQITKMCSSLKRRY
jgi:hypothetical protein